MILKELLKLPEKELQELFLRYQAILAAVPDIIMEVDAGKVYTWANQAGFDFFGEDVLGKKASHYFEGEQSTYERVQPLFNGDENVIYIESRQRRRDGEKRLLAWWCRVLKDANGDVKGAISTARDITEQTLSEEQIQQQNQLFQSTIEAIPHPFYVIDAMTYKIVVANSATAVFGDISKDSTCYALTHNCDKPCRGMEHMCPLEIVKKSRKPVTLEHIHYDRDGRSRCIELNGYPIFDSDGKVIQMIEYGLDITERKRVEEKLRESEERFRSVLQSAHDAIISIDSRGMITFWNKKAEAMFGHSVREAIGKPVSIIIPERFRDKHQKGMERVVSTGQSKIIGKTVELEGLKRDGDEFPLELSLAKWETREGIFFSGILRDISERKRAEAELLQINERMRSNLEAAAQVQESLLPKACMEIQGVRYASVFRPCEELGGDIFNVFQLDETHMGIYILDVSGHGVPAAMLSVTLSHLMSPQPGQSSILKQRTGRSPEYRLVGPAEVAGQLNRQFPMDPVKLQYFTLVYGILDMETNEFRYVVAGHPGPIHLLRGSGTAVLDFSGVPIGTFEDADYTEYTVTLKSGDRLYFYSDGITEATNASDELFGSKRLINVLEESRDKPLLDGVSAVVKNVEEWCSCAKLDDDLSILAIEIAEHDTPGDQG